MNYDTDFISGYDALMDFEAKATKPLVIAIKQNEDICYPYTTKITSDLEESFFYVKKIILSLIWMIGGNEIIIKDNKEIYSYLLNQMTMDEELIKTKKNMELVFHKEMKITFTTDDIKEKSNIIPLSNDFKGCRIGFDAGGSDRKVSAVIDGRVVFSEEVLWLPKEQDDWHYHYDGILESMKHAFNHLPRVDAIGVSTAGIVMNDEIAQSNLFIKVPEDDQINHVRKIFKDISKKEFGGVPVKVANDGDVTAMGGENAFGRTHILGIALGTSEAAGYCMQHSFNGWINELGKVPFRFDSKADAHYQSGVKGAGSEYLSQKGIIKLCKRVGIEFGGTLAEQLVQIQKEAASGNEIVLHCYQDEGVYLGSAIALYHNFLDIKSVLLLGRVMTGVGGEIIINTAKKYLKDRGLSKIEVFTADENFKRLGQSYMAASLVKIH